MAKADQRFGQRDGSDQNFDYMFKLLIIGNSSVGKTSFLFRYADDSFSNSFVSTVGIDFKVKTVYRNDKRIKLQIWDTAGQERYRTITTAYYRGAMGFILMYDITNEESFNAVQDWATQIKTYSWDNAQVIMVGNKCDMAEERVIPPEKGKHLADQLERRKVAPRRPLSPSRRGSGHVTRGLLPPPQQEPRPQAAVEMSNTPARGAAVGGASDLQDDPEIIRSPSDPRNFSDPDDLPGLAHFLEHSECVGGASRPPVCVCVCVCVSRETCCPSVTVVTVCVRPSVVFMGSQRFPEENGLDAFLRGRGGSANASTDVERTVFQLDVQKRHFREALDRCGRGGARQIKAQLKQIKRSEFQLIRASDTHRRLALLGSLARAGHPLSKFLWGNAQTLKLEPRQKRISTYERLRLFWRRFYSAHYMTLAVQSRETLDTLEDWVRDVFVHVPNK
ncbi:unnamed protein product [Tetraodon nigroviridis]|uniref:small monomeric GTPase n=1 Tax=Tetraodon nigroviridis TaxID=99883 RepID=Q4SZ30_TETNG|nr:unnamed protein product [Tetraodon nigroviridis]